MGGVVDIKAHRERQLLMGGGHATRRRAQRKVHPAWAREVAAARETAQLLQDAANEKRAERTPEPLVIGPLAVGVDPRTGEHVTLSELRREYHPGTSEDFLAADKAERLRNPVERAIKAVGTVSALISRAKGLFRKGA